VTDPYSDPWTGVLHNKLHIEDPDELAEAEFTLVSMRDAQIGRAVVPGAYDLAHLQRFHRQLFGDVYYWAGELRTVNIQKPGASFCFAPHISSSAASDVFPLIAKYDYLRGPDRDLFLDRLAETLGEVNALHPFREGNGRTQRAFFRQLGAAAGWRLDWAALDPGTNISACRTAMSGNVEPLRKALDPLVTSL